MKANKKTKHLQKEGEKDETVKEIRKKNAGEDGQERTNTTKEPGEIWFLARLQKTWSRMSGCERRKTSKKEERSPDELPGPSKSHVMDGTVVPVPEKSAGETQDQEEQQKKEVKAKKGQTFLACLRKPLEWITDLKWRGSYKIRESCGIPGPSHMVDSRVNISSKGKEMEDDEGKENITNTSEEMMENSRSVKDFNSIVQNTALELSCHKETSNKSDFSLEQPGSSMASSPGTLPLSLDAFTFHRALGAGGFGQVFSATDIIRKECVAIKVEEKRDFIQLGYNFVERQILQGSHESPYLIHGLAAFHTPNFVYYVMELATRGDLQDFIQDYFPFDTATVKFITAEVICGTEFLHRKDILHRDLKPRNILLTTDGHVKITDFGLAVTGVHKRTKEVCPSTPGYAAPEIVRRQEHGRAVDFFSIGVILYRLHLFMSPFDGRDPIDIQYSVLFRTPHYPESLTPDTVSIIKGLLCKNQFQRLGVNGEIRNHPFFSEVNWEDVEARRMAPPATLMAGSLDPNITENLDYAEPPNKVKFNPQKKFNEFSFVCPEWSKQYHPVIIQNKNWMLKILTKMNPQSKDS